MFKEATEVYSQVSEPIYNGPSKLFTELTSCKPFLKWAGGKSQLLPTLEKFIPKKFNKYIEPFVGGGALFFRLHHRHSVISDSNEDLILTYKIVRDDVYNLIHLLDTYVNNEDFFYNTRKLDPNGLSDLERAARIIYLNKTCFNGLYRVNRKGEFNVPYNKENTIKFYSKEALINCSHSLQETVILHADYQNTLNDYASKGDLVFLDPPYQPVGKYADFKRYTKERFHERDHVDLFLQFKKLVERGCHVILTNSDHPLIHDLFKDFQIKIVETKRLISSDAATRKGKDIIVLGGI
jgi:DNA adenine methylase